MESQLGVTRGRVLLITKTDFTDPRDGGTLRVSAVANCLEAGGFNVDSVSARSSDGAIRPAGRRIIRQSLADWDWWIAILKTAASILRVGSVTVARWYSPALCAQIVDLVRTHDYAAVLVEYSQLLVYRGLFDDDLPVILDMHNIEHELLANYADSAPSGWRRLLAKYETSRVRALEQRARHLTDAIATVSGHDADIVRRMPGNADVVVAPNGVSDNAFHVVRTSSGSGPVVFIGLLGWQPNVEAAHWLVQRVWPSVNRRRPNAELQLIGRAPAKSLMRYHGIDGVSVHSDVPSTLPYLSAAAVATAPLRAAGGTRLKILEAMATGTPVVSTALGALGLEHLAASGVMEIADDPHEFADALIHFIDSGSDPETVREEVGAYRWRLALQPLIEAISAKADHFQGHAR